MKRNKQEEEEKEDAEANGSKKGSNPKYEV